MGAEIAPMWRLGLLVFAIVITRASQFGLLLRYVCCDRFS